MSDETLTHRGTVLIVAGEFPPLKTIGRIRTVKFVEHLRALGWTAIVLTLEATGDEPNYDPALEDEVPTRIGVVRVPLVTFDERITGFAKRLLQRADKNASAASNATTGNDLATGEADAHASAGFSGRLQHLIKHWIRLGLEVPDSYLPWALKATRVAKTACAEHNVDVVFTTLPPFSAAYIGYRVRKDLDIPWVADYRDLWYGDVLREWLPGWRRRLEFWMEKRLLRRADVIVTVSKQKTDYMRRLHPSLPVRWETLTNGYDSEIYAGRTRTRNFDDGILEFVYTGRLFKNRRGYAFAEALGRIKQNDPGLVKPVRVRILGGVSSEIRARFDEILARYDIASHFDFAGDVDYQQAMDAQVNCDYLLLIVDTGDTSDGVIPGKLFEYVAAGRPIFALCNPGATQEIIDRARLGQVVGAEDVSACERALKSLLQQPVPIALDRDDQYLARFDRKAITAELAKLFSETVERN